MSSNDICRVDHSSRIATTTTEDHHHHFPSSTMAPPRRQSASKTAPPQQPTTTNTPSNVPTPIFRSIPTQPISKLKIHPLLGLYEATIQSLIGTLSEDPFRPESIQELTKRLLQCEQELEEALDECNVPLDALIRTMGLMRVGVVKRHYANTMRIKLLQKQNAELSKLFTSNLTSLSEARTLLSSLPDSQPAIIDSTPSSSRQN